MNEELLKLHPITILLEAYGCKHITTDFDDGEIMVIYEDPNNKKITITIMHQDW